jgi:CheY-like chemotaxis protein
MATLAPPAEAAAKPSITRGRILVVDDEPVMGAVLRRIFGRAHDVTVVDHAKAALAAIDGGAQFDVVLCDVVMPDLSGPQLYEAVRQRHPCLLDRFVFITGGALHEKSSRFLASISNPVLSKPFELHAVRELVRRLVSRA